MTPERRKEALAWARGHDTGLSSKVIFTTLMGIPWMLSFTESPPLDPDDFGRCHRLLEQFPEWRERMPEVAEKFPEWAPLVENWDQMTSLYLRDLESGTCRELYELMTKLLRG
jgi:hypothetical protein